MNKKLLYMPAIFMGLMLIMDPCLGQDKNINRRVDSLLRLMTLEEKIGQLNQYNDDWEATGPVTLDTAKETQVRNGQVGSILNCMGTTRTRKWQELAMRSRLKIPLLFGQDVIHGYKTTFPIPLAEACSWDPDAIHRSARVSATEASAAGINWTFAPMVDIARDPRWGRVMEGAGEDPYLGSEIAGARVKGFQGSNPGDTDALMACAKHFAAYGAAIGGRDYNSVDMSDQQLWNIYLPPFRAAVDAKVATFMCAFNDLNGVPCTGNPYLMRTILKGKWQFRGFVVSDWGSVGQMVSMGVVKNGSDAARLAITAGCDMDMESRDYKDHLAQLVKDGLVPLSTVDEAVKRILQKKFELGLFDNPYKFCNPQREQRELNDTSHTAAARDMARKSIVLLKNHDQLLPLSKQIRTLALVGPLMKEVMQNKGAWDANIPGLDSGYVVSQWEGIERKVGNRTRLLYARGCGIDDTSRKGFAEAVRVAQQSDVVVLSIGESRDMSGESKSRSRINIPGVQEALLKALLSAGKPVVVLINAGRPLVFPYTAEAASAILYTWWLGSEAGDAIADVLFGDYNPSARLAITFPRSEGQIPMYYDHLNTGHPAGNDSNHMYTASYQDISIYPAYAFGFGLSYTSFQYSHLRLSSRKIKPGEQLKVTLDVTNKGDRDGVETVQLYLHEEVASLSRPVEELKDFRKVSLKAGETKEVSFLIDREKLSFYNQKLDWVLEPGVFDIMVGASSGDIRLRDTFGLAQ